MKPDQFQSKNKDRVVFIGFRGTGKTTLARKISGIIHWDYYSTDQLVEENAGLSITRIVEDKGWDFFRTVETEILSALREVSNAVIDCGGGVVGNDKNMDILRKRSWIVWVDADLTTIYRNIRNSGERPLLNQNDLFTDIEINYNLRLPLYKKYGQVYVNTSQEPVDYICKKILKEMRIK